MLNNIIDILCGWYVPYIGTCHLIIYTRVGIYNRSYFVKNNSTIKCVPFKDKLYDVNYSLDGYHIYVTLKNKKLYFFITFTPLINLLFVFYHIILCFQKSK